MRTYTVFVIFILLIIGIAEFFKEVVIFSNPQGFENIWVKLFALGLMVIILMFTPETQRSEKDIPYILSKALQFCAFMILFGIIGKDGFIPATRLELTWAAIFLLLQLVVLNAQWFLYKEDSFILVTKFEKVFAAGYGIACSGTLFYLGLDGIAFAVIVYTSYVFALHNHHHFKIKYSNL